MGNPYPYMNLLDDTNRTGIRAAFKQQNSNKFHEIEFREKFAKKIPKRPKW